MTNNLPRAIAAIKAGDTETGQRLLVQVIKVDPQNETAWLWMTSTLDDPQEKKQCLQKVLQINPDNEMAKKVLAAFERPREPAELPRFGDISPKPAQKTAPSTGLAGSRLWRLSLAVLGGVAVLLVLCIGAMLVLPAIVGREALVSMFSPSNPPGEQSLTGTAAPAIEPEQTFQAYPPTWTPVAPYTPSPTQTPVSTLVPSLTFTPRPTPMPTPTPGPPTATPIPAHDVRNETQAIGPTWDDFWEGRARFAVEVTDTGLPMGESDTVVISDDELWSYVHASNRSAGTIDRCGAPVEFPGCVVIYRSNDGGYTFHHDEPPLCQFECQQCPCDSDRDHVDQQQYPRVYQDGGTLILVYEYQGRVMLRRSGDGVAWGLPEEVPFSGIWTVGLRGCAEAEGIGVHPFVAHQYDCLVGGPPGVFVEDRRIYVFVAIGQNPGAMGCYYGTADAPAANLRKCRNNPLFVGAAEYGPLSEYGPQSNGYFDFRTISSADVQRVDGRYYMVYEGIRGPGPGDPGDSQFGLGLARSLTGQIDGPWEKFPGNPILVDLPGNIGLGHADLVVVNGQTLLYTSLDGVTRSRLALVWE